MCGYENSLFGIVMVKSLGACVLRDCLRSFADSVFRKFSREQESDRRLDFARRHGLVLHEPRRFRCDLLEEIVDERVHDAHGLGGDTSVGVDLLEDLVDVDGVGLLPLVLLLLLVALGDGLGGLAGLLGSFSRDLGRHDDGLVGSDVLSEDDRSGQV